MVDLLVYLVLAIGHSLLAISYLVPNLIFDLGVSLPNFDFHFFLMLFQGIVFTFYKRLNFLGLLDDVLLDDFGLVSHEDLDIRNHTFPIAICVGHVLGVDDKRVEMGSLQEKEMASDDQAFSVDFTPVLVSVEDLLSHNLLVTLRDDGDQEIQKDDQCQDDVEEPEGPNQEDHEVASEHVIHATVDGFLILNVLDPFLIAWHS